MNTYYLILPLVLFYLCFSLNATIQILKWETLSNAKKVVQIVLSWSIPFIWYLLVKELIAPSKFKTMTKKTRRKLRKDENKNFYESGIGIHG